MLREFKKWLEAMKKTVPPQSLLGQTVGPVSIICLVNSASRLMLLLSFNVGVGERFRTRQAMDVEELVKTFGGTICFNGGVDVQQLLVKGSTKDVKQTIRELVSLFDDLSGGYTGTTSHTIMAETPLDNIVAMYEAFIEIQRTS